jgi:hypothetical protein
MFGGAVMVFLFGIVEEGHYPARIRVGDGVCGRAGQAFPTAGRSV